MKFIKNNFDLKWYKYQTHDKMKEWKSKKIFLLKGNSEKEKSSNSNTHNNIETIVHMDMDKIFDKKYLKKIIFTCL